MNESDIRSIIRQALREELAPILMGLVTSNKDQSRTNVRRFATEGELIGLRSIQPFGVSSRAPVNTPTLVVPVDADSSHLVSVGNFDQSKPSLNDGETILYSASGQLIYLKSDGTIHQGKKTAASPVVLGDVMKNAYSDLITTLRDAPAVGIDSFGLPVYLAPALIPLLTQLITKYVTSAATNIVAQKNFVDRGT